MSIFAKKNIQKKRIAAIVFLLLVLTSFLLKTPLRLVNAQNDGETTLNENVAEQLENLDLQALQQYIRSLENFEDADVTERILAYVKGESVSYGNFFKNVGDVIFKNIENLFPAIACIIAVSLVCGLTAHFKSGKLASSSNVIFLITYTAALIPLLTIVTECFTESKKAVDEMQKQMQIVFPLLLTLMSASGGSVSASICRPAVAFLSTNIVNTISEIVFPITLAVIVFSMIDHLSNDLKFGKFTAFLKSINKWIVGVSVSVFGLFFTIQGISAASYDGIARRAAKYAIGSGVPIVGGFLSGGFDLAVAGSALIKNALGNMSVFLMVVVVFEPLLLLLSTNLLLRFTAAITQPLGDGRLANFLSETADNLNYCVAGILFTAFLYFVCIVLIVCLSEAFV